MTNTHNLNTKDISSLSHKDPQGIAVLLPCTDQARARQTASILNSRAGIDCQVFIIYDSLLQGFIKTINQVFARLDVRYLVYLAQDAYPGRGWLHCAYTCLERTSKGLLAFNDGKWHGRIASFGMVRTSWVKTLYNGNFFYPGYKSHAADLELTVIAQALGEHVYNPNCTLVEIDSNKDKGGSNPEDHNLFLFRVKQCFDGLVEQDELDALDLQYRIEMRVPDLSQE